MARKVEMIERRNIICLACKERVSHLWFSLKRISSCNLVDKKLFSSNKQNCIQLFRCVSISSTYPCESVGQLLTLSNKSSAPSREKNARKSTRRCAKFTCIDCIDCIDWIECIECIEFIGCIDCIFCIDCINYIGCIDKCYVIWYLTENLVGYFITRCEKTGYNDHHH